MKNVWRSAKFNVIDESDSQFTFFLVEVFKIKMLTIKLFGALGQPAVFHTNNVIASCFPYK